MEHKCSEFHGLQVSFTMIFYNGSDTFISLLLQKKLLLILWTIHLFYWITSGKVHAVISYTDPLGLGHFLEMQSQLQPEVHLFTSLNKQIKFKCWHCWLTHPCQTQCHITVLSQQYYLGLKWHFSPHFRRDTKGVTGLHHWERTI